MKDKIVEHLADEAQFALFECQGEAAKLSKYSQLQTDPGSIDLACLRESIEKALKFVQLLTA